MWLRLLLSGPVALCLGFAAGCQQATTPPLAAEPSKPGPIIENGKPDPGATAVVGLPMPRVEPATLEARELAEYLNIEGWAFHYSGHLARVWVEIEEDGKKGFVPDRPEDHPNFGRSPRDDANPGGRIVLWTKPGDITLKVYGTYAGHYGKGLPDDALWWGWKSSTGQIVVLPGRADQKSATPRPGDEVTLLHYERIEGKEGAKDSNVPRRITILLKAKFVEGVRLSVGSRKGRGG